MGLFSPGEVRSLAKPAGAENLDTLDDVANAEAPSDRGVCGAGDGGGDWPYVASELVGGLFHVFLGGDPLARSGKLGAPAHRLDAAHRYHEQRGRLVVREALPFVEQTAPLRPCGELARHQ